MQIQKGYTGTNSDGDSYAKSQWKLVKFHLIGTDIGAKMGTAAIGIGIGTCIGIGIGSLETLLHIIIIISESGSGNTPRSEDIREYDGFIGIMMGSSEAVQETNENVTQLHTRGRLNPTSVSVKTVHVMYKSKEAIIRSFKPK